MCYRRKTWDLDELLALCALISIWICAIIAPKNAAVPAEAFSAEPTGTVLIIDPGHGGMDGGACAPDGTKESEINLSVSLKIRDLCVLLGIPVQMTREREDLDYPPEITSIAERKRWDTLRRCEVINSVENASLISIHQNFYPSNVPQGIQVLYSAQDASRQWGEQVQAELSSALCPDNRRAAIPVDRSIYIMNHIHCPAILVECGFLSHPLEAQKLKDAGYQLCLAAVLANSALERMEEHTI